MNAYRLAVAVLLLSPVIVTAQDPCWTAPVVFYPSYCLPMCETPIEYCIPVMPSCGPVEVPVCPPPQPAPATTAPAPAPPPRKDSTPKSPALAPPTAAPPSERPKSQTSLSPSSTDSGNEPAGYYDVFPVAPRGSSSASGGRVRFLNLTDRDLTVRVDGDTRAIARGKTLSVDPGQSFVWQVEDREAKRETIGKDEAGLDIVIRR